MAKVKQVRSIAHAVIRRVIEENPGPADRVEFAIESAYPFGERKGPVYDIWREECERLMAEVGERRVSAA